MTPQFPDVRYTWFILAILLIVYTYSFIDRQILSLLVEPIKAQLRISETGLGILQGTSFALFFSILGIPIGLLADRSDRRNLIIAGVLLWSLATALCGVAHSFWGLFTDRVAVGVGEACLAPAAYSMISDYFRPAQRGRALTVYTSGVYLGAGLAFVVGGSVISFAARRTLTANFRGGRPSIRPLWWPSGSSRACRRVPWVLCSASPEWLCSWRYR